MRRQRAEAHGRDVEQRHRRRAGCSRARRSRTAVLGRRVVLRCDRVVDPLVPLRVHVALGAEGLVLGDVLRALVDDCAVSRSNGCRRCRARRSTAGSRGGSLQEESEVADDRVDPPDAVLALHQVVDGEQDRARSKGPRARPTTDSPRPTARSRRWRRAPRPTAGTKRVIVWATGAGSVAEVPADSPAWYCVEHVLGDQDLVDLVGAVGQPQRARALVHRGEREVARDAGRAPDLDRPVDDPVVGRRARRS